MQPPATTLEASSAATLTCFAINSTATASAADACCGKYASNWKNFISNRKAQPGRASLVRQFNNPVSRGNKVQYSIKLVGSPMSLHGDLSCVAYFFSRWRPKVERVDPPKTLVPETEKKPATLRLVTALLGLGHIRSCAKSFDRPPEASA